MAMIGGLLPMHLAGLKYSAQSNLDLPPTELKVTVDAFSKQKRSELKYHKGELWMTFE